MSSFLLVPLWKVHVSAYWSLFRGEKTEAQWVEAFRLVQSRPDSEHLRTHSHLATVRNDKRMWTTGTLASLALGPQDILAEGSVRVQEDPQKAGPVGWTPCQNASPFYAWRVFLAIKFSPPSCWRACHQLLGNEMNN